MLASGCGSSEELMPEAVADPQHDITVGAVMSAPGLISGIDPTQVTGLEVELMDAVVHRLASAPSAPDVAWSPVSAQTAVEALQTEAVDFVIGQLPGPELSDEVNWLGPYFDVEAALLTHRQPAEQPTSAQQDLNTPVVESLDDAAAATVCAVAGSLADVAELPVGERAVQQTVSECETGLRSGRYDAIAADNVQLAGLLTDPARAEYYTLVSWAQLVDDAAEATAEVAGDDEATDDDASEEPEIPAGLLETRQYWIGVSPAYCADAAQAIEELVTEGVLDELVQPWGESAGVSPDVVADVVAPTCSL